MASVVLRSVGAAVGNALLPGLGGAVLGANFGGIVDGKLGLSAHVNGPQLSNLSVQDSRYGAAIPLVYGKARLAGNVIWATDLMQTQHNSSGGKGGGGGSSVTTTSYTYSLHCAVGVCAGPIGGIRTIWGDSAIIYQDGVWASGICDSATIYIGSAGQSPDAFMQSILGTGQVPSYQGLAYVVFDNLQLSNFGNRLPNLTFEIVPQAGISNPILMGNVDAQVSQRDEAMSNGTMPPLIVSGGVGNVQTVLIGGYVANGSSVTFTVAAYDVTTSTPVMINRKSSGNFTAATPADCAWALSPDGRFIAMYVQNATAPTHNFVIYDTVAQNFGAVTSINLALSFSMKVITWIDSQHFVIDDAAGTTRGLHTFARAGLNLVDLGFTAVWNSTNLNTLYPLYGAAFTPYADGVIAYVAVTTAPNVITLQARTVAWRNNGLSLGPIFTVASGLALGNGNLMAARFIASATGEWTLFFGTVVDYRMLSFDAGASSAVITRPWQIFPLSYGVGTTNAPVFYGDRLIVVERSAYENNYRLSEILLGNGSFTQTITSLAVGGGNAIVFSFNALRLDGQRLLVIGSGGFAYDVGQLAILARNASGSVGAIVSDLLNRAGYANSDYNVTALSTTGIQGYVVQDVMSARSAIEPLQAYLPFDLIESQGQLNAVLRGGASIAAVPFSETRAASEDKTQPPALLTTRAQEMDLPREVDVDYIDPSRNYEINSGRARRTATAARSVQKITLPVVCDAHMAKQIAEARLYTMWAERDLIKLFVSRAWSMLDPADVITLGNGNNLRITAVTQRGGLLELSGFYTTNATLNSAAQADAGQSIAGRLNTTVTPTLYLLDLPLLRSGDDQPGVYVAASAPYGWAGASLLRSSDGVTYATITTLQNAATAGSAATVLAAGSAFYIDNANTVTVQLVQGSLSSCSFIDLTNGTNAALLGREIIQFQNANLIGPGLYQLSGLLRGRRGTENAIGSHSVGETFIVLQSGAVDFVPDKLSDRGRSYQFRALASGQSLSAALDTTFTYGMQSLCPLSPATVQATRSQGITGDLTLTWARRARLNAEWVDYIDVPLDEPTEQYQVDILNGSAVIRSFTGLNAPNVTYTTAQQSADWGGSIPRQFTINIMQISTRYGQGNAATVTV